MNKTKKIHIVIGTKAQLIKMAPIMSRLEKKNINYNFIFTGQHQATIDEIRKNFSIKAPNIILHKGKDITGIIQMFFWFIKISAKALFQKKKIFGKTNKNDILLTHGDTFSTLLGALMGKLARIKVGHVESGLRSFNIWQPFPEELTRILTFYLSDYYFCPGKWAVNNLKKFKGKKINTKHNTLYDSLKSALKNKKNNITETKEKFCICSIHRFENIFKKEQFENIINNISNISKTIKILFILHPPTQSQLKKYNFEKKLKNNKNIELKPRYNYFDFIHLLNKSEFLITDGGSNQEESYYLGKPCLILRKATERPEGINKNAIISNYDKKKINEFVKNYKKHIISFKETVTSPSDIIINNIL